MKLGDFTFTWDPDKWTPPEEHRDNAEEKTYTSIAFFSWGSRIIGEKILLEWEWMPEDQYRRIKMLESADAQVEWDPETDDRLFYASGVNMPFVIGRTITGQTSGATATISQVDIPNANLILTGITGTFQAAETINDDSIPIKSAVITSLEIIPIYNVEIKSCIGKFFQTSGPAFCYRQDVEVQLLIISEA